MYWMQGEAQAPLLVRKCIASWQRHNPDWEITVLDQQSANNLVDLSEFANRDDMGVQMTSDILRMQLLKTYGGVWVDASLYCIKPLDEWLPEYLHDNFFAFSSKRNDRLMTNWFLAGTGDSQTLNVWLDHTLSYWRDNKFTSAGYWSKQIVRKLMSLRKRNKITNEFWFSSFVCRFLKVRPYPINMYLFEKALDGHAELKSAWLKRPALYDDAAEHLQNVLKMNGPQTEESKNYLLQSVTPVHKLNWRQDQGSVTPGSNFEFLLAQF